MVTDAMAIMETTDTSEAANTYVRSRYARPEWAKGAIGREDAAFLFDMVAALRPRNLAEVGVASGVSTVFLSTLLSDRFPESRLYACDKRTTLYDNPSKPVGAFLFEVFGRVPSNLTLEPGVSSSAIRSSQRRPERFDFIFLDANHDHPWPCLDLLSLLDIVQPGAWIVLHDVRLPLIVKDNPGFGPLYLSRRWPGAKKMLGGVGANIGAIRLFEDPRQSADALMCVLELPWTNAVAGQEWRSALTSLENIDAGQADQLRSIIGEPRIERRGPSRDREFVLKNANRWTRFAPDLVSEPLILHANLPGQPVSSLVIRGLDSRTCRGLVFPNIMRAPGATSPLRARLSIDCDAVFEERAVDLLLTDSESRWATLFAPEHYVGTFDVTISVELTAKDAKLQDAWVRFDAIHFV
jgi:predicted O-methyltransferase YrrM